MSRKLSLQASLDERRGPRSLADSRILVVDDHQANLQLLRRVLDGDGFINVRLVDDSVAALALAHEWQPDLIVLDLHMPVLDGVGFLDRFRSSQSRSEFIPVLVLTADTTQEAFRRALSAGANDYATKPFELDELLLRVRNLLSIRVCHEELKGRNHQLAAELRERSRLDAQHDADRQVLARRVKAVIAGGGPTMWFQPIVELSTNRTIGVEALARFDDHEQRTPDRWFHDAFAIGAGVELEVSAVVAALAHLRDLSAEQYLAVNLSPVTTFAPALQMVLADAPLHRVVLEITEHEAVDNYEDLARVITALRERGARLAVDDAGAGFASMRHILKLTPDIIKLDLQLTRDIDIDPVRRALAAALVRFGADIGSTITAEGIETEAELATLVELGVTSGQGYLLGRPGPLGAGASGPMHSQTSARFD